MLEVARYSVVETLRDGRPVEIRALRPDDRTDFLAAIGRVREESLRRRFLGPRRFFSEPEIAYFLNVDFVEHVALVAVVEEDGHPTIVGGGRYIVLRPGQAEIGFTVVDQYQRQGIGTALMRHLAMIAREVGLRELIAEVLTDKLSDAQGVREKRVPPREGIQPRGRLHRASTALTGRPLTEQRNSRVVQSP